MFFKLVYYLGGAFFFIVSLLRVMGTTQRTKNMFFIMKWNKNNDTTNMKWNEYPEAIKHQIIGLFVITIPFFIWLIIGVFSFNWVLYVAMLAFTLITNPISSFSLKYNLKGLYGVYNLFYYLTVAVFCLFVIINTFHLQIDFKQLLF